MGATAPCHGTSSIAGCSVWASERILSGSVAFTQVTTMLRVGNPLSAIDPASKIRPDWWTDDTYLHLAAIEDQALPGRGLLGDERTHPTLPVLGDLIKAVWQLGKTGGHDDCSERAVEALRSVELCAGRAAAAARLTLSQRTDRCEDDELAVSDRECEKIDPDFGPPLAHLTQATFTVRLPGYSGDSISGSLRVDDEAVLTVTGSGPLADLDLLGRLDTRAVIDAIENLVVRQLSRPIAP
ncbi:hypothetical protein [Streptomyces brasiliscabiei]|uniref:hypothetical protein n=1 Tax=Streptomyces brasiliscabiei TaxID=2736302 RepID=UPI003014EE10